MNPILFTASKGAERVMYAQEVRANNLANANTIGFKSIMEVSSPMKLTGAGFESSITTRTNSSTNDFATGNNMRTERDLDLMVNGRGFFTLTNEANPEKEVYTRSGQFTVTAEGDLKLGSYHVMGEDGPIQVPEFQKIEISDEGIVNVIPAGGGAQIQVGQLKLVNPDTKAMTLDSSGHFVSTSGVNLAADPMVSVQSGFLESSNVSATEELISIMALTRQYEMQVKMMAAGNEIAEIGNRIIQG